MKASLSTELEKVCNEKSAAERKVMLCYYSFCTNIEVHKSHRIINCSCLLVFDTNLLVFDTNSLPQLFFPTSFEIVDFCRPFRMRTCTSDRKSIISVCSSTIVAFSQILTQLMRLINDLK